MRVFESILLILMMFISSAVVADAQTSTKIPIPEDIVVYDGYFAREENDGKMARLSGNSHYMKFYGPDRVIRLFIPYPYSKNVQPETISKIFQQVSKHSAVDVYLKDTFGYLEEKAVVNIGRFRRVAGDIMFDCGMSSPCKINFADKRLEIIKKGVLTDHAIVYDHINL